MVSSANSVPVSGSMGEENVKGGSCESRQEEAAVAQQEERRLTHGTHSNGDHASESCTDESSCGDSSSPEDDPEQPGGMRPFNGGFYGGMPSSLSEEEAPSAKKSGVQFNRKFWIILGVFVLVCVAAVATGMICQRGNETEKEPKWMPKLEVSLRSEPVQKSSKAAPGDAADAQEEKEGPKLEASSMNVKQVQNLKNAPPGNPMIMEKTAVDSHTTQETANLLVQEVQNNVAEIAARGQQKAAQAWTTTQQAAGKARQQLGERAVQLAETGKKQLEVTGQRVGELAEQGRQMRQTAVDATQKAMGTGSELVQELQTNVTERGQQMRATAVDATQTAVGKARQQLEHHKKEAKRRYAAIKQGATDRVNWVRKMLPSRRQLMFGCLLGLMTRGCTYVAQDIDHYQKDLTTCSLAVHNRNTDLQNVGLQPVEFSPGATGFSSYLGHKQNNLFGLIDPEFIKKDQFSEQGIARDIAHHLKENWVDLSPLDQCNAVTEQQQKNLSEWQRQEVADWKDASLKSMEDVHDKFETALENRNPKEVAELFEEWTEAIFPSVAEKSRLFRESVNHRQWFVRGLVQGHTGSHITPLPPSSKSLRSEWEIVKKYPRQLELSPVRLFWDEVSMLEGSSQPGKPIWQLLKDMALQEIKLNEGEAELPLCHYTLELFKEVISARAAHTVVDQI